MKNIEITEENINVYQKLYKAKMGTNKSWFLKSLTGIYIAAMMLSFVCGYGPFLDFVIKTLFSFGATAPFSGIYGTIYVAVLIGSPILTTFLTYYGFKEVDKITDKINLKKFEKEHPDFDINIGIDELEKELNKYQELSKIPKDIEKQKEEHMPNLQEIFKNMSTEEKLAFLEQEKQFWQQVQTKEELTQEKTDTQEVGYQKKIGSINN